MKHKFDYKTQKKRYKIDKKFTIPGFEPRPQKMSTAAQRTTSWATMVVGGIAAKSLNEST